MNPLSLIPAPYQLLAKLIGSALVLIALWFAWQEFTGHYIDIGRAQLQPTVDQLKRNVDSLQTANNQQAVAISEQNKQVDALRDESDKRKAAGATALAVAIKNSADLKNKADWLSNLLAKPDAKTKGCAAALQEWRVQP